jgi:hypothetical protein
VIESAKKFVNMVLRSTGLRLVGTSDFPAELSPEDKKVFDYVVRNRLSMVSDERLYATMMACRYVAERKIEGVYVECGVWRGGNSIVAADVLKRIAPEREVYLFDTFAGMTEPTEADVTHHGSAASSIYRRNQTDTHNVWAYSPLDAVKRNFENYGLLDSRVRFVRGDVLETLGRPDLLPRTIAVLRLDTDWYESTKKELEVLYPRLSVGGVLVIDDYGHWGGARKAVDEYFANRARPFFQYTDYTGRMGIKPP